MRLEESTFHGNAHEPGRGGTNGQNDAPVVIGLSVSTRRPASSVKRSRLRYAVHLHLGGPGRLARWRRRSVPTHRPQGRQRHRPRLHSPAGGTSRRTSCGHVHPAVARRLCCFQSAALAQWGHRNREARRRQRRAAAAASSDRMGIGAGNVLGALLHLLGHRAEDCLSIGMAGAQASSGAGGRPRCVCGYSPIPLSLQPFSDHE